MMRRTTSFVLAAAFLTASAAALAQMQDPPAGQWGKRANLLEANSEFAAGELNGKIYVLGGYPSSRVTQTTVQVYDIATDRWTRGPDLPVRNNHGMAVSVNGKLYLIGGQMEADGGDSYVDTVYELEPATNRWTEKARMPTRRSAAAPVVLDGKIYVAGGRPPRGHDFAVYDPATDKWEVLPDLPTQRNHIVGEAIAGKIHVVGGRLGGGFQSDKVAAHEVFDPKTRTWGVAAPMLKPRSGINGVLANGCFHVWGGEEAAGVFPDHDYYDPRNDRWTKLPNMTLPIHGVTGSTFRNGLIWATGGGTQVGGSSGSLHNQVYRPAVTCN